MKTMKISKSLLIYAETEKEKEVVYSRSRSGSNNKTSKLLDIPRRTVDRIINRVFGRAIEAGYDNTPSQPNILLIDIETAPVMGYLWSLWQQGISLNAIESPSYILCWAAKWLGEKDVMSGSICWDSEYEPGYEDDSSMLEGIWNLMDQADFVVAHNGDRFDIKRLNTRFLLNGMERPSPYKSIDTLKIAKRCFAFDSNKLEHLLRQLFGYGKMDSGGMDTWIGCMKGDRDSWDKMIEYNKDDVLKLEELYLKIRSWDYLHPSVATHTGLRDVPVCTVCGSTEVSSDGGTVSTKVSIFDTWRCGDCGNVMRERMSKLSASEKLPLLVGVK